MVNNDNKLVAQEYHAQKPDFDKGVEFWAGTEATVNGVLGGYGPTTPVPRLDAASSRLLLLSLIPQLSTITPPHLSSPPPRRSTPYRALDCGAGIGRITASVLLPLFPLVDLVEPVPSFLAAATKHAAEGRDGWKLTKAAPAGGEVRQVRLWRAGLQFFDPAAPAVAVDGGEVELVAKIGGGDWPEEGGESWEGEKGLDVCWVQWCVGHLSHDQLVAFLRRAKAALRRNQAGEVDGFIVVKENICKDDDGDGAGALFDEDDSSTTRSDKVFRLVFEEAGLTLKRREVQKGFPIELFPVISYVLQ